MESTVVQDDSESLTCESQWTPNFVSPVLHNDFDITALIIGLSLLSLPSSFTLTELLFVTCVNRTVNELWIKLVTSVELLDAVGLVNMTFDDRRGLMVGSRTRRI